MRKKLFTFLLALVTSVGLSWAVPTEFANCYDCWRNPEYPTNSGQCRLYNFGNPYVGNNNPSGPWKLEFVGNYDSSSSEYDSNIVSSYAANEYGKTPEQMEVYRLYQWQNGAYQPVAYGVLYAYANENNPVEHAAFFEAGGHWGCYFTDNTHSGGDDFNITFNEDASTGFADLHGSTPTPAGLQVTELTVPASWQNDYTSVTASDLPGFVAYSLEEAGAWTAPTEGAVKLIYTFDDGVKATSFFDGVWQEEYMGGFGRWLLFSWASSGQRIFYTSDGSTPVPANPEIKLYADFGGDWADTEAFTDNGDGTATLTIPSLEAKHNAIFVKKDGVQMSSGHNFTRENPSADVSGNQLAMWFDTDEAGEYTFTFEYSTNILTITYPTATPTPAPSDDANKLPGAFSVSGTKVVYFSKGNLQATTADNGNTWTWGFAENQYDFIGAAAANNAINGGGTVSANGAVDLFGWSSNANDYYGIDNSTSVDDYSGNFQDWGAKVGSDWRALNGAQWEYLLLTREPGSLAGGTSNPRFTRATILTDGTAPSKDIFGLILFPDDFNDGDEYIEGVTWNGINSHSSYVSPTYCTTAGWATLESMGCVFLPAPGWRSGDEVNYVGAYGIYWSSTKDSEEDASCIYFSNTDVAAFHSYFSTGASVRLVSETAPSPATAGLQVTELQIPASWQNDQTLVTISDLPGFVAVSLEEAKTWDAAPAGYANLIYAGQNDEGVTVTYFVDGVWGNDLPVGGFTRADIFGWASYGDRNFYTSGGSTPAVDPEPTSNPSGSCGANVTWEFDPSTGALTITGTGAMDDYLNNASTPWNSYITDITSVTITDGVTNVGNHSFEQCTSLTTVTIGDDVETIGTFAFSECGEQFTTLTLGNSIRTIGNQAFASNNGITGFTLPSTLETIGNYAFIHNKAITTLTIPSNVTSIDVDAFYGCTAVTDVYCYPNAADLTWDDGDCDDFKSGKATICHVNADQLDAYQTKFNDLVRVTFVGDLDAPTPTPSGDGDKLAGAFSVGGDKVVYFSKGNLQATTNDLGATWTWGFAENQYDVIGDAVANNAINGGGTVSSNGAVDLFGWSSNANNYYGINNSMSVDDYSGNFQDWGAKMGSDWRTLTQAEWNYILNSRSTDYRFSYAELHIGDKYYHGLIILPDDWDPSYYALSPESMNQGNHSYDSNVISEEDWTNSLEAHGAVFLPASGIRTGNEVEEWYGDKTGNYWTSFAVNDANACYLNVAAGWGVEIGAMARWKGLAVRLVSETAPGGGSTPAVDPAVQNVIDLINAIPNQVAYNDECKNAIDAARAAYDALTDAQKTLVANYGVLTDAETAYAQLTPVVTNYSISLDGITENADKVTLNKASAAEGETITLTPAAGYQITAFTASYASAYSVRVTADPNVNVYDATPYVGTLPKEFTENVTPGLNGATFHSIEGDDPFTPVPASVLEYVGMNAAKDQMTIRVNDAFSGIIRVYYTYNEETCEWDEYSQQEICMGGTAQASVRVVCEAAGGVAPASKDAVTGAYSFTMPTGNVTITATVEAIPGPSYIDADFAIDFMSDPYTVVGGGALPTGVEVEGSMNTGDAQHGYRLPVITIPVTAGNYKVMMGTCSYSNQDATIKTEDNSYTYATLETNNGTCYHQNTATNVVGAIFNVPSDQIIKVYGAEYTPFFSIEKMAAVPAFTDFEINFQSDPYNVISGAKPEGTVIAGSYNDGQHGYHNVEATVPMQAGNYRLTLGACGYGNGAGSVISETNVELASFNQKLEDNNKCYHQDPANNIVSMIFTVDIDQTITIDCGEYTPYMKLEKLQDNTYYINFENAEGAIGTVPGEIAVAAGDSWTIPANLTLYKEGYTFVGWSDGVNTYAPGDEFFPNAHGTLHAVYTANSVSIADASTINVKWYFGESNGAPSVTWNGAAGYLLAKGEVDGELIDLKLDINATASNAKFDNNGRGDKWAQVNANTVFTFPSKEGAVVNVETHSGNVTYDLGDGTLTCNTNDYYSYLEIVYPAPTTAVVIGDPNDADQVTDFLDTYNGQLVQDLTIDRPVLNNMYNTLCLPFNMDADQIAASSLNGVEIYEFVDADVTNDELYLYTSEQKHEIVAGRPYLVKFSAASQLDDLDFVNVTINNTNLEDQAVTIKGVTFKGTFQPVVLGAQTELDFNGGHLFLAANNTLYWPNTNNPLKPFRAYFTVNVDAGQSAGMPVRRGMPAHIGGPAQIVTGVENVQGDNVQGTKVVENGVLYIIKNGVKYNAQGQEVK